MEEQHQAMIGRRTISPGEVIFREGDISDQIYVIESGVIALQRRDGADWVQVARLGPNNILGETALIENRTHSLRAVAETETVVAILSNQPFLRALKQMDPAISLLIAGMARKLEVATALYSKLKSAEDRPPAAPVHAPAREEPVAPPPPMLRDAPPALAEAAVPPLPPAPPPPPLHAAAGGAPHHHPEEYYSFPVAPHPGDAGAPMPHVVPRAKRPLRAHPLWWQATALIVLALGVTYFAFLRFGGASEAEFRSAYLALDENADLQGRTVKAFLECLANHGRVLPAPPNPVTVQKGVSGDFSITAQLRSPTIFHFQLRNRPNLPVPVAVMERVEYLVPDHGYAQAIDLEAKQVFVRLACE